MLAACLAVLVVLAGIGAGVEERLTRSDLVVPGSKSAEARERAKKHFGESHSLVVMVEGPRKAVDAQGASWLGGWTRTRGWPPSGRGRAGPPASCARRRPAR